MYAISYTSDAIGYQRDTEVSLHISMCESTTNSHLHPFYVSLGLHLIMAADLLLGPNCAGKQSDWFRTYLLREREREGRRYKGLLVAVLPISEQSFWSSRRTLLNDFMNESRGVDLVRNMPLTCHWVYFLFVYTFILFFNAFTYFYTYMPTLYSDHRWKSPSITVTTVITVLKVDQGFL